MVALHLSRSSFERFECLEAEITLDDGVFHVSRLGWQEYHNAYDADENFSLIRIDVLFRSGTTELEVPAFASKDSTEVWTWRVRFQPLMSGEWRCRVRVLVWHTAGADDEPLDSQKTSRGGAPYYEHAFGFAEADYERHPAAEQRFTVHDAGRPGPLDVAESAENHHYFYRVHNRGGRYQRQPFFLAGLCRPWVAANGAWDSDLDRGADLFGPMAEAGCNVLYHWMAPWETQIVHQAAEEHPYRPGGPFVPCGGQPLGLPDRPLAYKRFDQGRARRMDEVLDLAAKHGILVFVAVMPHPSLRDVRHPWGDSCWSRQGPSTDPSRCNGFQLFEGPRGEAISIDEFFQADPSGDAGGWNRRLWKHWANYWRYLIARWGAHPALGAWVLLDELEGIGSSDSWWWDNRPHTGRWHDSLVAMIRGELRWKWEHADLPYSGDSLRHPLTSSTTYSQSPRRWSGILPSDAGLMHALANAGELPGHGDWNGHAQTLSFASHHAYPFVPCRGRWKGGGAGRQYHVARSWRRGPVRWERSNSARAEFINADRWLWDAICTRLAAWSRGNAASTRLITEYGCLERHQPPPVEAWNEYGRRVPGFTHFANWSAFALGMAGTPFKWNDGAAFGEMAARTSRGRTSAVWTIENYPPDSYVEMRNLLNFVDSLNLAALAPRTPGGRVIDEYGKPVPHISVFTLAAGDGTLLIAWLYDRTFESNGRALRRSLVLDPGSAHRRYSYEFFDTWAGQPLSDASGTVDTGHRGHCVLALPAFPTSPRITVRGVADGNDIAVRLDVVKAGIPSV